MQEADPPVVSDTPEEAQEQKKEAPLSAEYPKQVLFCDVCGIPPQFCMFDKKKAAKCREWLKSNHPALYERYYQGGGQQKKEGEEAGASKPEEKKQKKVRFQEAKDEKAGAAAAAKVTVKKLKRGGKKFIIVIDGLEEQGVDLKEAAKALRKRFACGTSVENKSVTVQGGFEQDVADFIVQTLGVKDVKVIQEGGTRKKKK